MGEWDQLVKLSEKVAVWKKKGWIPALGEAVRRGGDRESEGVGLRCVCVRDWRAGHRGGGVYTVSMGVQLGAWTGLAHGPGLDVWASCGLVTGLWLVFQQG